MSQPPQPAYPAYPAFPAYPCPSQMPYHFGAGYDNNSHLLNFIQDSAINQNVTESTRNLTHDIGQTDRNLTQSINGTTANVVNGVGAVKDTVFAGTLGLRDLVTSTSNSTQDSVQRNGLATNSTLTSMEQSGANRGRDILQAIERTSGEARYNTAVLSAMDRQASNDVARDIIAQTNRNTNEIVAGVSAGGVATNTNIAALNVAGSERSRDVMQSIERNAGETRYTSAVASAADRQLMGDLTRDVINNVSAGNVATNLGVAAANVANSERTRDILQSIERNAGESRYTNAVSSAADRQTMGDLIRDSTMQSNRGVSDILSSVAATGVAGLLATTNNGFEVKNLINQGTTQILAGSAAHYSSLLLENQKSLFETYKMKEVLSAQMAESKYEALKNKETLAAQIAECCCETKIEALKNTERLSSQFALSSCEAKYEALKNTQLISSQLAECCCELKEKVGGVYTRLDDTVRILDGNRVRDALSVANNEINLLKAIDYSSRRRCSPERRRDRSSERR